jgi:hypothetical protein
VEKMMLDKLTDEEVAYARFAAERFTRFMVELYDWSMTHNCEIGVNTYKDSIIVTFTKEDLRIKHAFSRSTLSTCDEMLVWTELENAFNALLEACTTL